MAHQLPDKADFKASDETGGMLLRPLYVVACINALSPLERKQVFSMFNLVPAPKTRG